MNMFKASLYSFDYRVDRIDNLDSTFWAFYWENDSFSRSHSWKHIIYKLKQGVTYDDKFIFHLQLNYQNEFKKNIISNENFSDESSLDSNHSVLEDVFLIFCFRNLPFQLWNRSTTNRMQWIMVAVHTGKSNLISHAINLIENEIFVDDINHTKPLFKDPTPFNNAVRYISSIEVRWLLDRDRRKTWISFIATKDMLESFGNNFINTLAEQITSLMWDLFWEIKYKANIFWRKIDMSYENNQFILNSFPDILNLTDNQQEEMTHFTNNFNQISDYNYLNDLNNIVNSILNSMN